MMMIAYVYVFIVFDQFVYFDTTVSATACAYFEESYNGGLLP